MRETAVILHRELFDRHGFVEFPNPWQSLKAYGRLYRAFDATIAECATNPERGQMIDGIARELGGHADIGRLFSDIPFRLKDRRGTSGKSSKSYLHLSRFSAAILAEQGHLSWTTAGQLGDMTRELIVATENLLAGPLLALGHIVGVESNVVLKLIRYEGRNRWGTTPHCDKSSLSLILHGSDNLEGLYVMPPGSVPFDVTRATCARLHTDALGNPLSSILLPGLFSGRIGLGGKASPHAVHALDDGLVRYSVIAFLIPTEPPLQTVVTDVPIAASSADGRLSRAPAR
jgi:hypothetical protein